MQSLLFSCEKAAFLIDQCEEQPLGLITRIRLGIHKLVCKNCQCYQDQAKLISGAMEKLKNNGANEDAKELCIKAKERMRKAMEEELNKKKMKNSFN